MDYQDALNMIPTEYRHYLIPIKGQAYVLVDGRVKMFTDEHRASGQKYVIHPAQFFDIGDIPHLKVTIESEMHGTTSATSRIFFGGTGANATNPVETAETGAIGRALGFMGYGLFGGIASADEMETALANGQQETNTAPILPPRRDDPYGLGATEKQCAFYASLLVKAGWQKDDADAEVERLREDRDSMSDAIDQIQKQKKDDPDARRKAFWAKARQAMEATNRTNEDLKGYIHRQFGLDSTKDLTDHQADEVLTWLSTEPEDDIPEPLPEAEKGMEAQHQLMQERQKLRDEVDAYIQANKPNEATINGWISKAKGGGKPWSDVVNVPVLRRIAELVREEAGKVKV